MSIRTDLAAELKEDLNTIPVGVEYENSDHKQFSISRITVSSPAGADALKKPMGCYITLESHSPIASLPYKDRARLIRKGAKEISDMTDQHKTVLIIVMIILVAPQK